MDHLLPLSKTHIKHFPHLEHFECTVCFELEPTAMRCSGPCKAALCLKCATAICKNNNKANCPQRCSNTPLRLEPIPDFKLQFNCPYDAENCKANIEGHQGFVDHCQACEHITTEAVQENLRKDEHICKQGHSLLFLDPNVSLHAFNQLSLETITHRCAGCGEMRFCRSYCGQCSIEETVAYCNDCRALPCTKDVCPLGHEFVRIEAASNYCDLCGFCIFLFSNHCFRDQECNFDICAACYHRLPQTHPLVPLQANLAHTIQFGKIQHKKPPQEDQHYSSSFSDEEEEEQGEDDNAIQFQNHFQEDSNEEEDEPDEQQEQEEQEEEQEEQQEQEEEEEEEEVMPADEPQLSDQEEIYFQQEQESNSDFQNQNGEWFQDID